MNIKKKYYLWTLILFAFIFITWGVFYLYIAGMMRSNTQQQLERTSDQIISGLGDEFAAMEQLVFTLSQNGMVKRFVAEEDNISYFQKAADVNELMSSSVSSRSLISNVIIFNHDGAFYRFRGSQGNVACKRIYYLLDKNDTPEHLVVNTSDGRLVGYGGGIYGSDGTRIGSIAVLVDEEAILARLRNFDTTDNLHVSVAANDEIIISDTLEYVGMKTGNIQSSSHYYTGQHIGVTPFSIIVTADIGYLGTLNLYFTVAAFVTVIILVVSLVFFAAMLRRNFFQPMLKVLKNVENLDLNITPNVIPFVNSGEFDKLVVKLNEMLGRIDAKNKSIQKTQLLLKNAEIKHHKALLYSLKKQINAHFTVNILNIIKILMSKEELESAAELCDGLSMLVRYAHDDDEFINAWDEFYILQNYLNIMNIRYENKFDATFDMDDKLMDCRIPRMLLQPIVENAIVHGYKNQRSDCIIEITARDVGELIIINIRDYGDSMSDEALSSLRRQLANPYSDGETAGGVENVALININRRITNYYGGDCGIDFRHVSPKGLEVELKIGKYPKNIQMS